MVVDRREEIERFFAAYAKRSDDALHEPPVEDVEGVIESFAPFFVEASPKGVAGGPNDASFRKAIPEGFANYRKVGGKAMRIARIKVTDLDDINSHARVDWEFDYERPADGRKGTIAFQNIYLMNFAGGPPKIFAYITPDEEQAMKDHGLL
jgi:hypothetical protein